MLILNLGIFDNIIPDYNPRTLVPCLKKISFGMLAPAIRSRSFCKVGGTIPFSATNLVAFWMSPSPSIVMYSPAITSMSFSSFQNLRCSIPWFHPC